MNLDDSSTMHPEYDLPSFTDHSDAERKDDGNKAKKSGKPLKSVVTVPDSRRATTHQSPALCDNVVLPPHKKANTSSSGSSCSGWSSSWDKDHRRGLNLGCHSSRSWASGDDQSSSSRQALLPFLGGRGVAAANPVLLPSLQGRGVAAAKPSAPPIPSGKGCCSS